LGVEVVEVDMTDDALQERKNDPASRFKRFG